MIELHRRSRSQHDRNHPKSSSFPPTYHSNPQILLKWEPVNSRAFPKIKEFPQYTGCTIWMRDVQRGNFSYFLFLFFMTRNPLILLRPQIFLMMMISKFQIHNTTHKLSLQSVNLHSVFRRKCSSHTHLTVHLHEK